MKLNAKQQDVLDKMANGWQLGYSVGSRSSGWHSIQKGGQGYGGECLGVHRSTVDALQRRGLIKQVYGFPTSIYVLVGGFKK